MAHTIKEELQLWEFAKTIRSNHDSQWDRISRFLFPFGGDFQSVRTEGQQRNREIYDNTPTRALFKSGAILEALFAPRHTRWQSIKTVDPEVNARHEVQEYFEQVRNVLFESRDSGFSNFYGEKAVGYLSTSAYGNECLLVEETLQNSRIRYQSMPIQDVWVVYNELRKASVFYVQFKLSAFAASRRWPDNTPKSVRDAMDKDPWGDLHFLHVIRPRDGADPNPQVNTPSDELPFSSLEIDLKGQELIGEESGFFELPYMYSRNIVVPGESYGRGFGDQVLPDTATLQTQERIFLGMGERAMAPALLTTEEGPFGYGQHKIKVGPDVVIYGGLDDRGNVLMRPLDNGAKLDISEAMMEQKRTAIEDTFLVNLFQIFQEGQMTLGEVMVRVSERGELIAPLAGSQESELFEPMTQREIGIHFRANRLPEMPDALKEIGGKISLVYDNKATRFTRAGRIVAVQNGLEFLGQVAQFDPTVVEIPDFHKIVREVWDLSGSGASNLKSPEDVEAAVAAQAEALQAQTVTEALPDLASAGKDLVDSGIIEPEEARQALGAAA